MQKPSRLLLALAALVSLAQAADEDANLKHFRDIAETRGYSLGHPVAPKLTPDGRTVIYLRGGARDPVMRLYEFPLPSGPERELLTPEQLLGTTTEKLSAEEKARRERARVTLKGFTRFDLSKDGTQLLVSLSGQLYVINRATLAVAALPGTNWIDPRFSPDGTAVAAVSERELHVIDLATERAVRSRPGPLKHSPTAALSLSHRRRWIAPRATGGRLIRNRSPTRKPMNRRSRCATSPTRFILRPLPRPSFTRARVPPMPQSASV